MTDSKDSKNHLPTQKKIEDAREKGEIARSQEVNTATVYLAFCICIVSFGREILEGTVLTLRAIWEIGITTQARDIAVSPIGALRTALLQQLTLLGLVFVIMPAMVIVVNIARQSIIFTVGNIAFKRSRISPIEGIKNKIGPSGLFDFAKGIAKSTLFTLILIVFTAPPLEGFSIFVGFEHGQFLDYKFSTLKLLLIYISAISIVLAIFDIAWQKHLFTKKNMMSFQEMKEEMKDTESDPHFKAIRRQRGVDLTSTQLSQAIKEADVVIVNPTHFAAALSWDPQQAPAPIICATGIDHRALHIKAMAREIGIPIYVDIQTARSLAINLNVGDSIEPKHYAAVAAAIKFSKRQRRETFSSL